MEHEIVYSSTELLGIRKTTTINGNDCYAIHTTDCPVNVFTPRSTMFIAVEHAGNIHIFNLKEDGVFPVEFKEYIEQIRRMLYEFFFEPIKLLKSIALWREMNNNSHNFAIIRKQPCPKLIELTNAKSIVSELNDALKQTCPDFHLVIDYITSFPRDSTASLYSDITLNSYFQPHIVLCLFTVNDCVSSITITVNDGSLAIYSKTDTRYKWRKFNTLLRAVAIIVSKRLDERVERLDSSAINIISAFLMIKRFNAVAREGSINKDTPNIDEIIKSFFVDACGMETHVELNDANIANATRVFHETIQRMNCGPLAAAGADSGGRINPKRRKIRRTRRRTMTTRRTRRTRRIS